MKLANNPQQNSTSPERSIINGLRYVIDDCMKVPQTIEEDLYQKTSDDGSIGGHTRHMLEFFQLFVAQAKTGKIDYEQRQRNAMFETSPEAAERAFIKVKNDLETLCSDQNLYTMISVSEMPGFGLGKIEVQSSLAREALFLIEHAIHHIAIIKLLAAQNGVEFEDGFGVAPSTLVYRTAKAA